LKVIHLAAALAVATFGLASFAVRADVPPPQDVPYQGTLKISVDATDVAHRIFRVHEVVPARPGPLTLLYPQWIPGNHSPTGPIDKLAGLVVKADGKVLSWKRDPFNVYAFHLDVPQGATAVDVEFQFLSAQDHGEGRVMMTPELLSLQWDKVSLYPAGYNIRGITADARVTLPAGWQAASALKPVSKNGDTLSYKPVTYNVLVDSPMIAGKYARRVDLDPGAATPVHMDFFADAPKYLAFTPEQIKPYRNLVQQMYRM